MISHKNGDMKEHTKRFVPIGFRICGLAIFGIFMAVIFAFAFGWLVMILWNHLMPSIFGLTTITYLQSVGLLVLTKLLLGGFGHPAGHPHRAHSHNLKNAFGCQSRDDSPTGQSRNDGPTAMGSIR
jgi:hypothetical protein